MKLKHKQTGEIVDLDIAILKAQFGGISVIPKPHLIQGEEYVYDSLAGLCEEWEDYKEPKGNWTIDPINENYIDDGKYTSPDELERYEELGLKFNTEEEAEKAVEKLKAWKRLKDKGFRITGWNKRYCDEINYRLDTTEDMSDDLDILFGGEE